MKIGVYMFVTDYSMSVVELAHTLEERGFESLFVPEHTHIPASRRGASGPELPRQYSHMLDPFVSLAAAAAATTRLRLGTGICLLTERDTIATAKAVASLDLISNGRFEFGIGAGWNAEEMANHGTVFETRFRVMADRAKAMKAIWTNDEASYAGEFTRFERIWSWPKPVQKPHPPILLGGNTKHTLRRVMDFGDGWFPFAQGGSIRRSACNSCVRPPKRRGATSGPCPRRCLAASPSAAISTAAARPALTACFWPCPPRARVRSCRCSTSTPPCLRDLEAVPRPLRFLEVKRLRPGQAVIAEDR
jgi:probable F420-dependent oxidoreductase